MTNLTLSQEKSLLKDLEKSYLELTGDRNATPNMLKKAHRKAYNQHQVINNYGRTTFKSITGSRRVNISNQDGSFYALFCVNTDQVINEKWYKTLKGAERAANKFFTN